MLFGGLVSRLSKGGAPYGACHGLFLRLIRDTKWTY